MFLGIDIGTSSVKAVVVYGDHRILATASAPLAVSRPLPQLVQWQYLHWLAAVVETACDRRFGNA